MSDTQRKGFGSIGRVTRNTDWHAWLTLLEKAQASAEVMTREAFAYGRDSPEVPVNDVLRLQRSNFLSLVANLADMRGDLKPPWAV